MAWLLALLLGWWGADRFYRGFTTSGVVKLLTCGGMGIWWLVDVIHIAVTGGRDRRGLPLAGFQKHKAATWAITSAFLVLGLIGTAAQGATDSVDSSYRVTQGSMTEHPAVDAAAPQNAATAVPTSAAPVSTPPPDLSTTSGVLATLPVKGRAPTTGYDRDLFAWRDDTDHNGCDTRNDILRRDLTSITLDPATGGCVVLSGELLSPYSGLSSHFDRNNSTIDIDHVVSLSDAWQTGASTWDDVKRREFANDPLNLLAVESTLNQQKGDGDAATWLPPNVSYRCEYVSRQVAVKAKYELWVKPAEAEAIERVLSACQGQVAFAAEVDWPQPGEGDILVVQHVEVTRPAPAPTPTERASRAPERATSEPPTRQPEPTRTPEPVKTSDAPQKDEGGSAYYKNCTAVRDAGAAPIHRGEPGYSKKLDRDGDGIACE